MVVVVKKLEVRFRDIHRVWKRALRRGRIATRFSLADHVLATSFLSKTSSIDRHQFNIQRVGIDDLFVFGISLEHLSVAPRILPT